MRVIDKVDNCLFLLDQWKTTKLEQEKLALMSFDLLALDEFCSFSEPLQTVLNWRKTSNECNKIDEEILKTLLGSCPLINFPEKPINSGFFLGVGSKI